MAPLNRIEIAIPEEVSLRLRPRQIDTDENDDASFTSEISLDILGKEREEEKPVGQSSVSSGWNPDGSDYTLDVLLHDKEDEVSTSESAKGSLMTSDYSLNIRLSQSQHSLKTSQHQPKPAAQQSLGGSQHSFATSKSIAKSVETELTEETARSKPSTSTSRKLTFSPRVRILRVPNRKDLLKAQMKRVWYSRDEFKDIRKECFDTIKLMQEGELIDEEEGLCTRGLEYKTTRAYRTRQRNKIDIRQVIFEEQAFQRECGMADPEWIARVSREQSRSCIAGALESAQRNEADASAYMIYDYAIDDTRHKSI